MTAYTVLLVFEGPALDRFLVVRHMRRGWELPGGRVEPGETPLQAAVREWREETGLGLAQVEPLLLHERPGVHVGHMFLGCVHAAPGIEVAGSVRSVQDEQVQEVRAVRRLAEVQPLAFPDDPYEALARAAHERARSLGWRMPDDAAGFVARLAGHAGVERTTHVVSPHPDAPRWAGDRS